MKKLIRKTILECVKVVLSAILAAIGLQSSGCVNIEHCDSLQNYGLTIEGE